ncbi:T22D4-like protein, partial [Mya arenaria]
GKNSLLVIDIGVSLTVENEQCSSNYVQRDLVKSHLMFAVREEVEVLKEQIAELIERNNQLEYENGILRAAASTETLAKLAQPRQQPPSSSS